jgi:hydrogenase maturation protein HypF
MGETRRRVLVGGVVQGVGFRPFVWRLARRHRLAGWVENTPDGVLIDVQGAADAVAAFVADLHRQPPPLAVVAGVRCDELPAEPRPAGDFAIHETEPLAAGPATAHVPPDIATCPACLAETLDPTNRRHRYPFTNCTDCGPRFTIITALPYDRPQTTMRAFTMCPRCAAEYANPADRRFHAQPNACRDCGPMVWFTTTAEEAGPALTRDASRIRDTQAIDAARQRLRAGDVLTIKGLGGFHLVCDATNAAAVGRLRDRKHRVGKPLAVMVADIAQARACGHVDAQEARLLESRERPIVLVRGRDDGPLCAAIAPGNDFVGLMLPHSPLHHLLCAGLPPLVMTSGNLSEEPIAFTNADAASRLAALVDGFLMHDREIHAACDDSVVRCVAGAVMPIRRSRGYAPLPVRLAESGPCVLAVGGELKATVCLARGTAAFMGPHIGDMGNLETLDALERSATHLLGLFDAAPEIVACDMHPGYLSAQWARRFAADRGIPVVAVQHHEAHVAALMAEHGLRDEPLIAVCFDGTGYGRDGTIHGGEVFLAEQGRLRRAAHLEPFPLPGGDASIMHPWRMALALLYAAGLDWSDRLAPCAAATDGERRLLRQQLEKNLNCAATSSMGRLFDAVAALAGVAESITYEAEAAMRLEAFAARSGSSGDFYPLPVTEGRPLRIDWRPLVAAAAGDAAAGVDAATIAARFHRGVAAMVTDVCDRLRAETGISRAGLTGGVFQNAWLVRLVGERLRAAGFDLLLHHRVPPNDGGLALGQAVFARAEACAARRAAR